MKLPRIENFQLPDGHLKSTIVCQIKGCKDVPVSAKNFAKLIKAQVALLEALEREKSGKVTTEWCLTESAVIGENASFTVTGYPKKFVAQMLRKARKTGGANEA